MPLLGNSGARRTERGTKVLGIASIISSPSATMSNFPRSTSPSPSPSPPSTPTSSPPRDKRKSQMSSPRLFDKFRRARSGGPRPTSPLTGNGWPARDTVPSSPLARSTTTSLPRISELVEEAPVTPGSDDDNTTSVENPIYLSPKKTSPATARAYLALLHDIDPALARMEKISVNGSTTVYRAHHRGLNALVAVKLVQCLDPNNPNLYFSNRDEAGKDFSIHLSLHHEHIIDILHIHRSSITPLVNIICEYLPNSMTLREYITRTAEEGGAIDDWKVMTIASQMVGALAFIHDRGIVHRDLKPEHILIHDEEMTVVKLACFGDAVRLDRSVLTQLPASTFIDFDFRYTAPEILDINRPGYDHRADIWSLGALIFELFVLDLPYRPFQRVYPERTPPKFLWPLLPLHRVPSDAQDFLSHLLRRDPSLRPSLTDATQLHPWFARPRLPIVFRDTDL
ncbi:Pkinase-domain-containing protein [Mycena indigotica]|uniref:Pkinase-domain-containing protein n=1 Tax=Mycena indigotica TaxID=2126181 RepID=A0A8H6S6G9_9AGAR|nr:Pkinase-domain-containing protein [Mycena indigotica]KAF7292692.1 Pkinase-domain-containing protein [Mycena indigotica]